MEINFAGKHILVTGGTGFIGSHLVETLLQQGAHVTVTYLRTIPHSYFSSKNLHHVCISAPVDICNFEKTYDLITKSGIEYIFHLAAQPLVDVAYINPRHTLEANIMGTVNILESARLFPTVRGVIVASSDKAYGKLKKDKYVESDALAGDHPYEVSKSATDLIAFSYFKTYGIPITTARFGNVYGEGDLNFSRIIPGIAKSILCNETLTLRSDGTYVRDYIYVKDVVRGYLQLASQIDKVKGESFNFGSKETLSVKQLIHVVEKALTRKVPYTIANHAKNEIPFQSLDYSKARKILQWEPQATVANTIAQILNWYKGISPIYLT